MKGTCIRFYLHEARRHHHLLAYEWLLEAAREIGIPGGSAFHAMAGYGRDGVLHEDHFFELAGDLPVVVEFIIADADAERLLALIRTEKLPLFYVRSAAEFGILNGDVRT